MALIELSSLVLLLPPDVLLLLFSIASINFCSNSNVIVSFSASKRSTSICKSSETSSAKSFSTTSCSLSNVNISTISFNSSTSFSSSTRIRSAFATAALSFAMSAILFFFTASSFSTLIRNSSYWRCHFVESFCIPWTFSSKSVYLSSKSLYLLFASSKCSFASDRAVSSACFNAAISPAAIASLSFREASKFASAAALLCFNKSFKRDTSFSFFDTTFSNSKLAFSSSSNFFEV